MLCSHFGRNTAPELEALLPKISKNQSLPAQQFPTNQQLSDIGNHFSAIGASSLNPSPFHLIPSLNY